MNGHECLCGSRARPPLLTWGHIVAAGVPVVGQFRVATRAVAAPVSLVAAVEVVARGVGKRQLHIAALPLTHGHRMALRSDVAAALRRNRVIEHGVVAELGITVIDCFCARGELSLGEALVPRADHALLRPIAVQRLGIAVVRFAEEAAHGRLFLAGLPVRISGHGTRAMHVPGVHHAGKAADSTAGTTNGTVAGVIIASLVGNCGTVVTSEGI